MDIARESFRHIVRQQVRWADMDVLGHVNNAVYFTWCESARLSLFDALGMEAMTDGWKRGPALVTATCDFRKQVRHPADIDVAVGVRRIGGKSFTLEYALFRAETDEVVATGSSVVVWVDYAAEASQPLPDALRTGLEGYVLPEAHAAG